MRIHFNIHRSRQDLPHCAAIGFFLLEIIQVLGKASTLIISLFEICMIELWHNSFDNRNARNLLTLKKIKGKESLISSTKCLASRKHFAMLSNAHPAKWRFQGQKDVIRWCARTVGNTFAIIVTRQLMDMTILGMSFWTLTCLTGMLFELGCKCLFFNGYRQHCQLFSREEVLNWEMQMNPRQVMGQIQAELHPTLVHPCPNCRQLNAKVCTRVTYLSYHFPIFQMRFMVFGMLSCIYLYLERCIFLIEMTFLHGN